MSANAKLKEPFPYGEEAVGSRKVTEDFVSEEWHADEIAKPVANDVAAAPAQPQTRVATGVATDNLFYLIPLPTNHDSRIGRVKLSRNDYMDVDATLPHFTKGIFGPENANRLGVNMDFDMNVLWIAGWYCRSAGQREQLLENLADMEEFQQCFGSTAKASRWLRDMVQALSAVPLLDGTEAGNAMPLQLVTDTIEAWHYKHDVLVRPDGSHLLSDIDLMYSSKLLDNAVSELCDEGRNGASLFTNAFDPYPGWTILNLLRYWSVIGRDNFLNLVPFGPQTSRSDLDSYMYHFQFPREE